MVVFYPHKQTIFIAVICVLAVLGTIIYVYGQNTPETIAQDNIITPMQPTINNSYIATSSTDWKKQFFVQNTGISSDMITASTSNSIQSDKPLTLTNQIGRELFTRFIDLKQNNLDSDPQLVQDVIDQTINNTTSGAAQAKQYSLTNISTLNQPTNTNYHDYGNNVATILLSDMPKIDAPTIASNAFDANDLSLLSEIDPLISAYQKVINNLLIIKTPQSIAQYHIDMINSISNLLFVSQELRNIEGDPAQSIVALEDYTTAQDSLKASLLGIKNTLQNKTSFTSIEPGTLFNTITP